MLSNRSIIEITIAVWIIIASLYLIHTPHDHRGHDHWQHFFNTEYIVKMHKLPPPYEHWETYHPPLYYFINSFITPTNVKSTKIEDKVIHINYVRALSVLYGAIVLFLLNSILIYFKFNPLSRLISLIFLCTTPKFAFTFSIYNNDSLALLFSTVMIYSLFKIFKKWSNKWALILLIATTLGLYTKMTIFFLIFFIVTFCCRSFLKKELPNKVDKKVMVTMCLSVALLFPWMFLHNLQHTGKLLPNNNHVIKDKGVDTHIKSALPLLYKDTIKGNEKKWTSPWVLPTWQSSPPDTKRYDYWSYFYITSVIGEYRFHKPHVNFIWALFFLHLIIYLFGLSKSTKSNINKLALSSIIFCHIIHILYLQFSISNAKFLIPSVMDFRYFGWLWISWIILFASTLDTGKNKVNKYLASVFLLGTLVNVYVLMTVEGGFWW